MKHRYVISAEVETDNAAFTEDRYDLTIELVIKALDKLHGVRVQAHSIVTAPIYDPNGNRVGALRIQDERDDGWVNSISSTTSR